MDLVFGTTRPPGLGLCGLASPKERWELTGDGASVGGDENWPRSLVISPCDDGSAEYFDEDDGEGR